MQKTLVDRLVTVLIVEFGLFLWMLEVAGSWWATWLSLPAFVVVYAATASSLLVLLVAPSLRHWSSRIVRGFAVLLFLSVIVPHLLGTTQGTSDFALAGFALVLYLGESKRPDAAGDSTTTPS